ncbi:hypothetical protein [Arcobacter sp. LA11]|uniref:hypothetical protein n=1 Tax=Arcobacter sp. LA11 TaxID=1898176 RepID=UPI00093240DC|nr:hypothetical protein [Arcobacter sp. LA11]
MSKIEIKFEFDFGENRSFTNEFTKEQLCSLLEIINVGGRKKMNNCCFHSNGNNLSYSASKMNGKKYELKRNSVKNEIISKLRRYGHSC